jgi:hypothetical protein
MASRARRDGAVMLGTLETMADCVSLETAFRDLEEIVGVG